MILLKTIRGKDILYLSRNASFSLLAWPNKLVYLRFVNYYFCVYTTYYLLVFNSGVI